MPAYIVGLTKNEFGLGEDQVGYSCIITHGSVVVVVVQVQGTKKKEAAEHDRVADEAQGNSGGGGFGGARMPGAAPPQSGGETSDITAEYDTTSDKDVVF